MCLLIVLTWDSYIVMSLIWVTSSMGHTGANRKSLRGPGNYRAKGADFSTTTDKSLWNDGTHVLRKISHYIQAYWRRSTCLSTRSLVTNMAQSLLINPLRLFCQLPALDGCMNGCTVLISWESRVIAELSGPIIATIQRQVRLNS